MRALVKFQEGWKLLLLAIGLLVCLFGCVTQRAFLQVVVCVSDQKGAADFKRLIRKIASEEHLNVADTSKENATFYAKTGIDRREKFDVSGTVFIEVSRWGGPYVFIENVRGHSHQMYIDFLEGWRPAKAHRLADRVVAEVSKRWRVEVTPEGQGSFPMKGCDG